MAKQPRTLAGRVVAITGAARGIGRATAAALVRRGARVAIGDLDADLARRTASEIGAGTAAFELDVTDRASFAGFLARVEETLGPIDVLVNNAGIMPLGRYVEESDDTAARQVDINLHGVIYGMKLALPRMVERRAGHVVNIASTAGKSGFPGGATYCATKHAVVGLSEAVLGEVSDAGVEISVICPAVVNTELAAGLRETRGVKTIQPEDVAEAIVGVLERPRFEVIVPRLAGGLIRTAAVIPRSWRERILRAVRG